MSKSAKPKSPARALDKKSKVMWSARIYVGSAAMLNRLATESGITVAECFEIAVACLNENPDIKRLIDMRKHAAKVLEAEARKASVRKPNLPKRRKAA